MASPKFNFSLPEDQKKKIEKASKILGVDMAEIIRISSFLFSKAVIEGDITKAMIQQLPKTIEEKKK
jgi:hypothetical protein